ncbi:anti-sigma factor [Hyphococcus sp.]|uniref:anti-sigma factor n=1 Tax=Hyphococcus sp. TaxID=2038636 RepID=UPI003CCB8C9F
MSEREDIYDDSILAGEYVLGVLDADECAQVRARIESDSDFAARVRFWEARLSPLAEEIAPHEAPAIVKQRVEETLFGAARKQHSLWESLSFWRAAAGFMTAVALIALGIILFARTPAAPERTSYIATILPADAAPVLAARIDGALTAIRIQNAAIEIAEGQSAELWLIPEDGTPRSLGLINPNGDDTVQIPAALSMLFNAGAALAVSIEPEGGSTSGAPTGPVIGLGVLKKL